MRKVAIVGVEGSGKTVMLAGLGELYSHPDENGYFLTPKNFNTAHYVSEKIARMRKGEWPAATAEDMMQGLDWTLRLKTAGSRPQDICSISCLDFAGEVYRNAFCSIGRHRESEEEKTLKRYIDECDNLIVLINLKDVITNGLENARVQQSMWITNEILAYALNDSDAGGQTITRRKPKRAAIVLSQADSYWSTIESCGGAAGTLEKYLPHVWNSYDWLDIFEASAVDMIRMDDDGNVFPHPDFQPTLLKPIMTWILNDEALYYDEDDQEEYASDQEYEAEDEVPQNNNVDSGTNAYVNPGTPPVNPQNYVINSNLPQAPAKPKSSFWEGIGGFGGFMFFLFMLAKIAKSCSASS